MTIEMEKPKRNDPLYYKWYYIYGKGEEINIRYNNSIKGRKSRTKMYEKLKIKRNSLGEVWRQHHNEVNKRYRINNKEKVAKLKKQERLRNKEREDKYFFSKFIKNNPTKISNIASKKGLILNWLKPYCNIYIFEYRLNLLLKEKHKKQDLKDFALFIYELIKKKRQYLMNKIKLKEILKQIKKLYKLNKKIQKAEKEKRQIRQKKKLCKTKEYIEEIKNKRRIRARIMAKNKLDTSIETIQKNYMNMNYRQFKLYYEECFFNENKLNDNQKELLNNCLDMKEFTEFKKKNLKGKK